MGGEPKTAMNIVGFPKGRLDIEILGAILRGGADKAFEAGAVVLGGHTIIDPEIKYGMAVTGVIHPDRIIRNVGVRAGDALVLTKPLGTGIIATTLKRRGSAEGADAAIASMTALNALASAVMCRYPVHACSDVTGFGLLGHAQEMAGGSDVTLQLNAAVLPLLPGAPDLAEEGHLTGGCTRNRTYLADKVTIDGSVRSGVIEVAFDPQTSGGLLIALPRADAPRLVEELRANGVAAATVVGSAMPREGPMVRLV
jgi:selenide,water dikinase